MLLQAPGQAAMVGGGCEITSVITTLSWSFCWFGMGGGRGFAKAG